MRASTVVGWMEIWCTHAHFYNERWWVRVIMMMRSPSDGKWKFLRRGNSNGAIDSSIEWLWSHVYIKLVEHTSVWHGNMTGTRKIIVLCETSKHAIVCRVYLSESAHCYRNEVSEWLLYAVNLERRTTQNFKTKLYNTLDTRFVKWLRQNKKPYWLAKHNWMSAKSHN